MRATSRTCSSFRDGKASGVLFIDKLTGKAEREKAEKDDATAAATARGSHAMFASIQGAISQCESRTLGVIDQGQGFLKEGEPLDAKGKRAMGRHLVSSAKAVRAKAPGAGDYTIATEVLINTPAVANLIREGQVAQLTTAMQAGSEVGMHTLDQDLRRLVEQGVIAQQVARQYADDPGYLDGVHVRPRDLDAEAWSMHAHEHMIQGI